MKKNRLKLIALIIIIIYTGFVATIITSYLVSRTALRNQIDNNSLPLTSDNIYSEISRDLLRPVFISSTMANDTFLRDWVINGENDITKITRYLKEIQDKYETVTSFFISDKTSLYYHTIGILKKISKESWRDEWYFKILDLENNYDINIDYDMANNDEITVFVNYKVYDYSHNLIGVTGVGLTLNKIQKLIESYSDKYQCDVFFTDETGNITLSTGDSYKNTNSIINISGLAEHSDIIFKQSQTNFLYKNDKKINKHFFSRYIPEFKWYLIVEKEEGEYFKKLRYSLFINLLISTVLALIIFYFTYNLVTLFQENLEKIATHDQLTSVYNRRGFTMIFEESLHELERLIDNISLIIIDIDNFKTINDTWGHAAGDMVLKNITKSITDNIRNSDIVCRWGGDEFLILLKNCRTENLLKISENIREGVMTSPTVYKDIKINTTVTLGIATFRENEDLDELVDRADKALYLAKYKGRNRCEIADN